MLVFVYVELSTGVSTMAAACFGLAWPLPPRARAQNASFQTVAARTGQEILLWEDEAAQDDFEA